jgi:peptide/nickel transport system permease protein
MWLGKSVAWRKRGLVTGLTTSGAILLYTAFPPWLSFLLSYAFITRLRLLSRSVDNMFWKDAPLAQNQFVVLMLLQLGVIVAVLLLLNWLLQRLTRRPMPAGLFVLLAGTAWVVSWRLMPWWPYTFDVAKRAALPLLAFTILSFGEVMLIMRTTMIDTLHEQYIQTARAKGLRLVDIRDRHAARNALLPVLSRLVISLPYLLTGAAMIEMTLNWEGVGTRLFYAVGRQDINTAIGGLLVIGVISLGARLLLDVLVALLDPRIRYGGAREAML